jgi:hypothetical protein
MTHATITRETVESVLADLVAGTIDAASAVEAGQTEVGGVLLVDVAMRIQQMSMPALRALLASAVEHLAVECRA